MSVGERIARLPTKNQLLKVLEESRLNENQLFTQTRKVVQEPKEVRNQTALPDNHPFFTTFNSLGDFVTQLEIDFGGQPYPGQEVREGHFPKYSDLIDKLEELALMFLEARQFADLLKDSNI